jgi:hypothetical protein
MTTAVFLIIAAVLLASAGHFAARGDPRTGRIRLRDCRPDTEEAASTERTAQRRNDEKAKDGERAMPLITINSGGDIPEGVYPVILAGIEGPKKITRDRDRTRARSSRSSRGSSSFSTASTRTRRSRRRRRRPRAALEAVRLPHGPVQRHAAAGEHERSRRRTSPAGWPWRRSALRHGLAADRQPRSRPGRDARPTGRDRDGCPCQRAGCPPQHPES